MPQAAVLVLCRGPSKRFEKMKGEAVEKGLPKTTDLAPTPPGNLLGRVEDPKAPNPEATSVEKARVWPAAAARLLVKRASRSTASRRIPACSRRLMTGGEGKEVEHKCGTTAGKMKNDKVHTICMPSRVLPRDEK